MNAFLSTLKEYDIKYRDYLKRDKLNTLQINLGNLCNQNCAHCHVGASPNGKNIMSKEVIDDILMFISKYSIKTLDITGGAPEMNKEFKYLVENARTRVDELIVRSNLTILNEEGYEWIIPFYRQMKVHIVCSMPCYLKQNVDRQRGDCTFNKSIDVLRKLNNEGFSKSEDLQLDLVYNPSGATLPPDQKLLETDYKKALNDTYDVNFNNLITITNVPIKRFKDYLVRKGEYEDYCKLLKENFNPNVLENLMCRTFLSVGYDGKVYDCDFNQALGLALKDESGKEMILDELHPEDLIGRKIIIGEHCLSCTAGSGSSCRGALLADEEIVTKESVKDYYGKVLRESKDLKTNACCCAGGMPTWQREILKQIEPEVVNKFYGCGSPIPLAADGIKVLDLGSGTGRDVYVVSKLVGEQGHVYGVDMTDEQLDVARKYQDIQANKFGFSKSNVTFLKGYIEDLKSLEIEDNSIDLVISNCVINLSPDKSSVFSEIFRVLKPGGELYFSDVFSSSRIPESIKKDPIFYGECLGGAMYIEDFRRMLVKLGCLDYRVMNKSIITIDNEEMEQKAGNITFFSMTIRAFKIASLEDICEDYGQVAIYKGTIENSVHEFVLDDHHTFIAHKPMLVCGNTAVMLQETRFKDHFEVSGNRNLHFGPFDCKPLSEKSSVDSKGGSCC